MNGKKLRVNLRDGFSKVNGVSSISSASGLTFLLFRYDDAPDVQMLDFVVDL